MVCRGLVALLAATTMTMDASQAKDDAKDRAARQNGATANATQLPLCNYTAEQLTFCGGIETASALLKRTYRKQARQHALTPLACSAVLFLYSIP